MITEHTQFHKLEAIANWQLDAENADVGLPALQRGYVWKPKQVETLWDSLLRGFPIGSFLVSDNKNTKEKKDLLDGQQRATAIAIGFYNPWETVKHVRFFSSKFKKNLEETIPVLWLDIAVTEDDEKGDFIFLPRLVTQSHPWGFNRNSQVLGIGSRRKANENFKGKYPHYNLKDVFPWDAKLPVPIVFLIDAINESKENWKKKVIEKSKKYLSQIPVHHFDKSPTYIDKLQELLDDRNISKKLETAIKTLLNLQIPIILLDKKQLEEESNTANAETSTLFVRINTMGTPLNGEELIYSIFKTTFPKSKEIVEAAGTGFIAPSRIITLISRIVLTDILIKKEEFKFANQPKLKEFKNAIKDTEGEFYNGMKLFAENEDLLTLLFKNIKSLLVGEKNYQLPVPLAIDVARNQDVFFILLFWFYKSEINVNDIIQDESLHKKILAAITSLNWFAVDMKQFLNVLSKHQTNESKVEFWDSKLFINSQLEKDNQWITIIPRPKRLQEILDKKFGAIWEDILSQDELLFHEFRKKLFRQFGILLFVQRKYIKERFKELQWDTLLEDTNRPWDWDHIYPSVYNQKETFVEIKELNYTIGNFRAWALEDNRKDQAKLPKDKFGVKEKEDSFIEDSDWKFWVEIDTERITTNTEKAKNVCFATYTRLANIYRDWYDTLNVGQLFDSENEPSKEEA